MVVAPEAMVGCLHLIIGSNFFITLFNFNYERTQRIYLPAHDAKYDEGGVPQLSWQLT
jgi:hypothetical protein